MKTGNGLRHQLGNGDGCSLTKDCCKFINRQGSGRNLRCRPGIAAGCEKQAQQQKLAEVNNKLQLAIQAVGREGGYICVFDIASGIPYISETLCDDLNAKVKAKLGIIK